MRLRASWLRDDWVWIASASVGWLLAAAVLLSSLSSWQPATGEDWSCDR